MSLQPMMAKQVECTTFKFTSKCACNNNIIKVSASYESLIDTDDPAKEMTKKSIVLINNHRTKKRNPDDSLVCNLYLTDFASFLRTDFAWRGLWADVQRQCRNTL
jgi:hypothetical protein